MTGDVPGQVPPPTEKLPAKNWGHLPVWEKVREAIYALPLYFRSETTISGLSATDIFTLSITLGATIEDNVVRTLNDMRSIWDPEGQYKLYGFVRQAQTFPDALLKRHAAPTERQDIVLGIELKGWYLLAKEAEPSFRFKVTPTACAPQDLLVIVPWALSNIISGTPQVYAPLVISARYAAEYRNYHWQHVRRTRSDATIKQPKRVTPYPAKSEQISDVPVADTGGNFGRIARTGIMDTYVEKVDREELRSIQVRYWRAFFKLFQEHEDEEMIQEGIKRLRERINTLHARPEDDKLASIERILEELQNIL